MAEVICMLEDGVCFLLLPVWTLIFLVTELVEIKGDLGWSYTATFTSECALSPSSFRPEFKSERLEIVFCVVEVNWCCYCCYYCCSFLRPITPLTITPLDLADETLEVDVTST